MTRPSIDRRLVDLTASRATANRRGFDGRGDEDRTVAEAAVTSCVEARGKLLTSRTRLATAADEARRRLQHDLHHGAQERLMHTVVVLKLARDALAAGGSPADLIDEALAQAEQASRQLADVVRGVLPTILVHGGLRPALESLVADLALVAETRLTTRRLPAVTETVAYLVLAEGLTNVARHACAERVSVAVELNGDVLTVEVRDDGVGGADPARGRGLTGLIDRIDAAGGVATIISPAGAGTVVRAAVPVDAV